MKTIIVLSVILAVSESASVNNRIVGGNDAAPGQFKFIVSLREANKDFHFCGAAIINSRVLLTAAHCKDFPVEDTVAVVGSHELNGPTARKYKLKSFIQHEKYIASANRNDIAVIVLTEDIEFGELVQPIPLTSRNVTDGERLTAAGWGQTEYPSEEVPNVLQWMQMNVMSHRECTHVTGNYFLDGKICTLEAKGQGICSGDSGGPLINELGELAGVSSSAYLCALGKPDYFTDVQYYKDWIIKNSKV